MEGQTFNLMTKQEIEAWVKNQDIVRVNCMKVGEEDKFIYTVGEFIASPQVFDSREEAELYLKENFKLTNLDLSIIGALFSRLSKVYTQLNKNEEK